MLIQERTYTATVEGYRFGFNGMEKVDEVSGSGNAYDFGARIYDSRLGRWMSVDPLYNHPKNISHSPYNFAINSPIMIIDKDGKIWWVVIGAAVGGTIDAAIGIAKGEDISQIGYRFVRGAAIGAAVTGLPIALGAVGVTGAATVQATIYATPVIYMAAEGLGQTTRYLISGGRRNYNMEEFTTNLVYALPETIADILMAGAGDVLTKPLKESVADKMVREGLGRSVEREIKEDIKKKLKNELKESGSKMTKKELRETTKRVYNQVLESETGEVMSKISKTQKKIDVTGVTIGNLSTKVPAEKIKSNDTNEE
jgi:RHS repeat-associated protein